MIKILLATMMTFLISGISYADELRLEAGASASLGDYTLTAEEQTRQELTVSTDLVTKAAPYEHTVFAVSKQVLEGPNGAVGVQLRIRNTNTDGESKNRISLDLNSDGGLPLLGLRVQNRLRLQLDEHSDITTIGTEDLRVRDQITLSKDVLGTTVSVGDELHVGTDASIKENRIVAALSKEVCKGFSVRAEYFRQHMVDGQDDANVVTAAATLRF
jgi:hypothetical protein